MRKEMPTNQNGKDHPDYCIPDSAKGFSHKFSLIIDRCDGHARR